MRNTKDRFPKLSVLRILVSLRFVDRAHFQCSCVFTNARYESFIGLDLRRSDLLWVFIVWTLRIHIKFRRGSNLERQKSAGFIKLSRFAFWPLIKSIRVHYNLPFRIDLHESPIHGSRRGTFEVNSLAVIAAAVTWTLEFVFARLPVRRAAEMSTARVNHEQPIRSLINPDSVLLLPFRIDAKRVVARKSNFENS